MNFRALVLAASCAASLLAVPAAQGAVTQAPEVTLLTPTDIEVVGETLTLTASAAEGTKVYYRIYGGAEEQATLLGPVTSAPFKEEFTARYSDFQIPVRIEALTCDDGAVPTASWGCAGKTSERTVVISRMNPALTKATTVFSPNGDGKFDTATLTYVLDQPSAPMLVVESTDDHLLGTAPLAPGPLPAGQHASVWNGLIDPLKDGPATHLTDGTYKLGVASGRRLSDSVEYGYGTAGQMIKVDVSARAAAAPDGAVFPVADKYRDKAKITVSAGESGRFTATVRSAQGKKLRTFTGTTNKSGKGTFNWDGYSSSAHLQKPGKYPTDVTFIDALGNKATTSTKVKVDGRHLAKRTASHSVNPTASSQGTLENDCNQVYFNFDPKVPGSLALNSEAGCVMLLKPNLAGTMHQYKAPIAPRYGSAIVEVSGHRLNNTGSVLFQFIDGDGFGVTGPRTSILVPGDTGQIGAVSFHTMGTGRAVRWAVSAHEGAQYVVDRFKVTWTYYVLVK